MCDDDREPTEVLADMLRKVSEGSETSFEVANELDADGLATGRRTLTVIQRKVNPEPIPQPVLARSPRRQHTFFNREGFTRYINKFGGEGTVILADPQGQKMAAILDETATTGFEVIRLDPMLHPLFQPWHAAIGRVMKVSSFVEFLRINRKSIIEPDGKSLVMMLSQLKIAKNYEIYDGSGKESVNGVVVRLNIGGKEQSNLVSIPETIRISVPLFVDSKAKDIEIDLTLGHNEQDGAVVKVSSADVLVQLVAEFTEMLTQIDFDLGNTATIAMGSPSHANWEVLR